MGSSDALSKKNHTAVCNPRCGVCRVIDVNASGVSTTTTTGQAGKAEQGQSARSGDDVGRDCHHALGTTVRVIDIENADRVSARHQDAVAVAAGRRGAQAEEDTFVS